MTHKQVATFFTSAFAFMSGIHFGAGHIFWGIWCLSLMATTIYARMNCED